MRKRIIAMLLVLALLVVSIAACGGGGTTSGSTSTATGGESNTTSTGGDTSEAGTTGDTGESGGNNAAAGIQTIVGTPRDETLIVECQNKTDTPGQFNTYMSGTATGFGIHQMMSCHLWEMNTAKGEQYGEIADGLPTSNEDFTEWTVKLRQGIKWSDGEDLNADDVVFTFNMIMTNDQIGAYSATNMYVQSVEKVDDYTVKFTMKEPFPRFTQRFGITVWGTDYRIVPEHIYSQQDDVTMFQDSAPVVAGPYTVAQYDSLGMWVLYQLRDDWQDSTLGVVGAAEFGYTPDQTPPKYVLFEAWADSTTKQMAMINNEADLLCEVTLEEFQTMNASNSNINCWYNVFPYANPDDPGSKGIVFSMGKGYPYDNADFRWGICLALDIDQISMNTFSGAGRAAPLPLMNNTQYLQETYLIPMQDWLLDFELDLGDGTTFKPYDTGYAKRMAEATGVTGKTDEELITMFGAGWWKHDEEAATKLLEKAGLEKNADGIWCIDGKPFQFELSYLADAEFQESRGVQAVYNQLQAFGFDCTIASKSSATWNADGGTGNFDIAGYWPSGGILKDFYSALSGFDNQLIVPLGETGSGQSMRWDNQTVSDILHELANTDPMDDRSYELHVEFFKECVREMCEINFLSGTKFVPTNSTYWEGYPNADNPYDGPWWWWSCFKYMLPNITPVQG